MRIKDLFLWVILLAASNLSAQNTTIFKNQTNDKFYHIVGGALISFIAYDFTTQNFKLESPLATQRRGLRVAMGSTLAAALIKEAYDYRKNKRVGTWDVPKRTDSVTDIAVTAISGLTVAVILSF
jgi:hypothetical protein